MNPLQQALIFIIETLFMFYTLCVVLRVLLQKLGANFYNPVCQLLVKLTQVPFRVLRRVIPGYRGIDWAGVVFAYGLELGKLLLLSLILANGIPAIAGLFTWPLVQVGNVILNIFLYGIIIQALLSWVSPLGRTPLHEILHIITEPVLKPMRRMIPPVSGFDLSPLPVIMLFYCAKIVIIYPLLAWTQSLMI